jgi:molybdopterin converting factor small subunit
VESPLRPVGLESQLRGPIDGGTGERNVQQNSHLHGRILRDVQFLSQEFLGSNCTSSLAPAASVLPLRLQEQTWLGKTCTRRRTSGYSGRMRVRLLTFGVLRDMAGLSDETVELKEGATVGELIEILRGRTSNDSTGNGVSEGLWRSLAAAVNREYSSLAEVLREGDEVALLPPVSGGCGGR